MPLPRRCLPLTLALLATVGLVACDAAGPREGDAGERTATPPVVAVPVPLATEEPAAASTPAAACTPDLAVTSANWGEAEGGRSLMVAPSPGVRRCGGLTAAGAGDPTGWASVVGLAGEEADTPTMREQYLCHLRFARTKATWNLEPWRPEVTRDELVRHRCNPPV